MNGYRIKSKSVLIGKEEFSFVQSALFISSITEFLGQRWPSSKKQAMRCNALAVKLSELWPGGTNPVHLAIMKENIEKLSSQKDQMDVSYAWTSFCIAVVEDMLWMVHPVTKLSVLNQKQRNCAILLHQQLKELHFHFDRGNVKYEWFVVATRKAEQWLRIINKIQGIQLYTDKHPEDQWRMDVEDMKSWVEQGVAFII